MLIPGRPFRFLFFALFFAVAGCHAQAPSGVPGNLSPELARRVEVLIRSRSNVPPSYVLDIGPRTKSDVPGFDEITVNFSSEGKQGKPVTFLLSSDGKTLAQFTKFDISQDPRQLVSGAGRPSRGGPPNAPVEIVLFHDLERPSSAKSHAQTSPAPPHPSAHPPRVVYRDFPLDQHPWAMRAAIDTNCVGAQSPAGYWNLVDHIHAHASELGGEQKSIAKANETLDNLAKEEGTRQHVNAETLAACLAKQDDTAVKASVKEAAGLGVDSTPALFINGERLEGAQPLEDVYRMIDGALVASGQKPPPAAPAQTKPGS